MLVLAVVGVQAQSIVKSLERNVPGQGKVTIHQDPRIEALIGMEPVSYTHLDVYKRQELGYAESADISNEEAMALYDKLSLIHI